MDYQYPTKLDFQAEILLELATKCNFVKKEHFVANKFVNKYKEFINWWDGTSDGFKKIVKGILKVIFWGGIACLIVLLGYRAFAWIAENTKNLPNIQ